MMERESSKTENCTIFSNPENTKDISSFDLPVCVTFSSMGSPEGFSDEGPRGATTRSQPKKKSHPESSALPPGVGPRERRSHDSSKPRTACGVHEGRGREEKTALRNGAVDCCCNDTLVDRTTETTLHGLKYVWMKDIILVRRALWMALILACSGIMMYQILDRIIYFSDMPVTVDVRINFNTSLGFPSVTVCNQNAFRASKAAELGVFNFLTDLQMKASPMSDQRLREHNASNTTMDELYKATRHHLEDFLISCRWRGQPCDQSDFRLTATDHGMCYTKDSGNLSVEAAGAEDGLSLTLNIEQYEYMTGPHSAAGVKILLHDRNEFPKVHALGQALSPGVHSFLAIRLVSVENLPFPHGECDSPVLKYYSHYGTANCETECTADLLGKLCSCKLFYMPGDIPVCTVMEYYTCFLPKKNTLRKMLKDECDCPVPCAFLVFDPVVSYADTSPLAVERFLANTNKTALGAKYDHAREVTHRLQREKRRLFARKVDDLQEKFDSLRKMSMDGVFAGLKQQREGLGMVNERVHEVYNRTRYLFEYQKFITEKGFVRAANAMSERTFDVVAAGMQEFVFKVDSKIQQLVDPAVTDTAVRSALYYVTLNEIDGRVDIAQRALKNYTDLYTAVLEGSPIFNYKFHSEPRKNSVYIVPLPLFRDALTRTPTIGVRSRRVGRDLKDIISSLAIYRNVTAEAFHEKAMNPADVQRANVLFLKACKEYLQSIDMFINDVLKYTVTFQERRLTQFADEWRQFAANRDSLSLQINTLSDLARKLEEEMFHRVGRGLNMSRAFLRDGSVKKRDVARLFLSEDMYTGESDLRHFFAELQTRGQEVYDLWNWLEKDSWKIYNVSLTDPNLQIYYNFKNDSGYFEALRLAQETFGELQAADIRLAIKNNDDKFLTSLAVVVADMQAFVDAGQINEDFVRTNLLRLTIFFRELNYEKITQQEAYDIFALLCDIGGSMGLFLGASVLTVFELLDLFVFRYALKN